MRLRNLIIAAVLLFAVFAIVIFKVPGKVGIDLIIALLESLVHMITSLFSILYFFFMLGSQDRMRGLAHMRGGLSLLLCTLAGVTANGLTANPIWTVVSLVLAFAIAQIVLYKILFR